MGIFDWFGYKSRKKRGYSDADWHRAFYAALSTKQAHCIWVREGETKITSATEMPQDAKLLLTVEAPRSGH